MPEKTRGAGLARALCLLLLLAGPAFGQPPGILPGGCLPPAMADPRQTLGPLGLGMTEDQVEQAIGAPDTRFEPQVDEVSGQHTHATSYACGASLAFLDNPEVATPGVLLAIILDQACDWRGVGGLRLGLEASEARAVLADQIEQGAQPLDGDGLSSEAVIYPDSGTVLLLRFRDEKVSYIYLGPDLRSGLR